MEDKPLIDTEKKRELFEFLSSFISENKRNLFSENIRHRTRYMTLVLENIYQPHNASAVLRSAECFGIQDVHIVENTNKYEVNPDVALGSAKWLSLKKYSSQNNNTIPCLTSLKDRGYRIIATTPHKEGYFPEALPLDKPFALVFGTELEGLSDSAIQMADSFVKIPMYGFTESLNISVSAAILLHTLSGRLRSSDFPWQLTQDEKLDILINWTKNVLKKADLVEKQFFKKTKKE